MDQIDDILHQDLDPTETQEWVESLSAVINREGTERAHFLLEKLVDSTRRSGGYLPFDPTTEYVNTIPPHMEAKMPGDGMAHPYADSLERDGDGRARQPQAR
jgi:pyruvate dehydrogenase E1 component